MRAVDLAAAAVDDEIAGRWVPNAAFADDAVANTADAGHGPQFLVRERLVKRPGGKIEVHALR